MGKSVLVCRKVACGSLETSLLFQQPVYPSELYYKEQNRSYDFYLRLLYNDSGCVIIRRRQTTTHRSSQGGVER